MEQFVSSEEQILELIEKGNKVRTTHATKSNDTSSRSHAVCQIKIQEEGVKKAISVMNSGRLTFNKYLMHTYVLMSEYQEICDKGKHALGVGSVGNG